MISIILGGASDATWRDVEDAVVVTETRDIEAKGFDGLVRIHRVSSIEGDYEI